MGSDDNIGNLKITEVQKARTGKVPSGNLAEGPLNNTDELV